MAETLLVERFPDRVVATLNRPEKRNAIDQATIDALHALCAELEAAPRTLILTGRAASSRRAPTSRSCGSAGRPTRARASTRRRSSASMSCRCP